MFKDSLLILKLLYTHRQTNQLPNCQTTKPSNRPTLRQTNPLTDIVTYRAAVTANKCEFLKVIE